MEIDRDRVASYQFDMSIIRRLRERKGLSQAQLAELVGTSAPQILRLEKGRRKLTVDWAERIAPHLGVAAFELLFPGATGRTPVADEPEAVSDLIRADDVEAGSAGVFHAFLHLLQFPEEEAAATAPVLAKAFVKVLQAPEEPVFGLDRSQILGSEASRLVRAFGRKTPQ